MDITEYKVYVKTNLGAFLVDDPLNVYNLEITTEDNDNANDWWFELNMREQEHSEEIPLKDVDWIGDEVRKREWNLAWNRKMITVRRRWVLKGHYLKI